MKHTILPAIFFVLIGLLGSVAQTQATTLTDSPYLLLAENNQNLDKAAHSIKQQTGGRILSAKTVTENGRRIYKIKVLMPSGKVKIFKVNAK